MERENGFRMVLVLSVLISVVLSGLLLLPIGGAEDNGTKLHGRVVDTNSSPVPDATVTLLDVHTGATQTYITSGSGKYEFFGVTGFFTVTAEAGGYFDNGQGHSDIVEVDTGELVVSYLTLSRIMTNCTYAGQVKDTYGDPVENATVAFFSTTNTKVSITTSTDVNGNYTVKLPWDEFKVMATADGYEYTITDLSVAGDNLSYDLVLEGRDGVDWLVYGFVEDNNTFDSVDAISVHLWDKNNGWFVPLVGEDSYVEDNYFQFKTYPGVFKLIVDAKGYHTYTLTDISIQDTTLDRSRSLAIPMIADEPEVIDTTITFSNDFETFTLVEDWTITSASELLGLGGIGSLRTQIDERFGTTADNTVDATEESEFQDFLLTMGPYHLYTDGFLMLNGSYYASDMASYTVDVTGVQGLVSSSNAIYVHSTVTYEAEGQVDPLASVDVKIEQLRDNQIIHMEFPGDYEVIDNLPTELAVVDPSDVSNVDVLKSATLLVMQREAPTAHISVVNIDGLTSINEKEYVVDIRQNITLSGSNSADAVGKIVQFDWNLSDSWTMSGEEITFNYTTGGSYNVTLTVTDTSGLTSTDWIVMITDTDPPNVGFRIENTTGSIITTTDQNVVVIFNGSMSTDNSEIASYTWTFQDDLETLTGVIVQHKFLDPGQFSVMLEATDINGLSANTSQTITIIDTEAPLPVIVLNNASGGIVENQAVEAGQDITLNGNQSYDERIKKEDWVYDLSYAWSVETANGTVKLAKTAFSIDAKLRLPQDVLEIPGRYDITLFVRDSTNNEANTTQSVQVLGPDLWVKEVKLDKNENDLKQNEVVKVSVNVTNSGSLDYDGNVTVVIKFDGVEKDSVILNGLTSGEAKTINLTFTPTKDGKDKLLTVVIDPDNEIKEEDETNNVYDTNTVVKKSEFNWQDLAVVGGILLVIVGAIVAWKWKQGDLDDLIDKFRSGGFKPSFGKGSSSDDEDDDDDEYDDDDED